MSDRPKLTLVDEALAAVQHDPRHDRVIRDVLTRFAPSIAKRARQDERDGYATERAEMVAAHAAAIEAAENAYRKAAQTAHRAGHAHGFWKGVGVGGAIAASAVFIGAAWYAGAVMKPAFEAAQQFRMQDQVVNQLDRSVNPPAPNYPGERP